MKDQLYKSYVSYVEYAEPYLRKKIPVLKGEETYKKIHIAHIDRSYWLRSITEKIEGSGEFNKLVTDFSDAFRSKSVKKLETGSMPYSSIKNFFRRSKFYLKIFEGKSVDIDKYFEQLWSAFNERQVKTISLRLLDGVYFPESVIDFRKFKIQRFSKKELDNLFDNKLSHIFYPYAELDTDKLSHYWFIREEREEKKQRVNFNIINIGITYNEIFRVSRTFPDRIIQLLALFDWGANKKRTSDKYDEDIGWLGFSIPISICITDDILKSPRPSPNLSDLEFIPVFDTHGEELGEEPQIYIHIEKDELQKLKFIVKESLRFLEDIDLKQCNWEFLDIAMGYLAKAFFAEGLDQLLWHIIILEALFGEKNEVMETIRRRVSNIFGKTESERKSIRKTINDLYDFRSDLVHGNIFNKQVFKRHLSEARSYARKSLLWFLAYLSNIQQNLTQKQNYSKDYPRRKELLMLLDFNKEALERIHYLIEKLPMNFPNINIWGN